MTKYFHVDEFACSCCGRVDMDAEFLECIDNLREACDFPFVVTSGFRCKEHNDKIGGAKGSQHLFGMGADIRLSGDKAHKVVSLAREYGFNGVGISQKGNYSGRFIHLDTRKGSFALWSY